MRQGQQNRRGRGRNSSSSGSSNNNNNNGRKPQNPLARNYESSGPDVKIRGTAAQVAEKYMALARDAASSGDSVMAENYLQHAEHYNRIIMAAQAQAAPMHQPHHGGEPMHGINGQHRPQADAQAMMREPQPVMEQPSLLPPGMEPQPDILDAPSSADSDTEAEASPAPQTPSAAPRDQDGGRRRRRRYPSGGAPRPDAAGTEQANGHNGSANGLDTSDEERPSDEIVAN